MNTEKQITWPPKSYTLRTDQGLWLGQIVITSDGMFSSVTDWGNLSNAWRSTGDEDFREFLIRINKEYFAGKLYSGNTYMIEGKKQEAFCKRFADKILPALQKVLIKEIQEEQIDPGWIDGFSANEFKNAICGNFEGEEDSNGL